MQTSISFPSLSPHSFLLDANEAHIFRLNLEDLYERTQELEALLNEEEKKRAARFISPIHQQRYIAARSTLRLILANYLHQDPSAIIFSYGEYGKPRLAGEGIDLLQFNLSHSHTMALYAITLHSPIGIDVEMINEKAKNKDIAKRFFTKNEFENIEKLTQEKQSQAFFKTWARKEAFLKALGKGLLYPLHDIDIGVDENDIVRINSMNEKDESIKSWSLYDIDAGSKYAAAVVVASEIQKISAWDWVSPI